MTALATARQHMDALRRRSPIEDVHTRLLLGQILDILSAQQEEIAQLSTQLRARLAANPAPCPRCIQRDDWATGAKIAAYLAGGPAGILTAMALHPRLVALYRKPHAGRVDAGTTDRR